MINHSSDILHVFFFISRDYSITAVKSPLFPVVCIGPWIKECAFKGFKGLVFIGYTWSLLKLHDNDLYSKLFHTRSLNSYLP